MDLLVLGMQDLDQSHLVKTLSALARGRSQDLSLYCLKTRQDLLAAVRADRGRQICFLYLESEEKDIGGLALAQEIYRRNPLARLVFMVSQVESVSLDVKHFLESLHFLSKDLQGNLLSQHLEGILDLMSQNDQMESLLHYDYQGQPAFEIPWGDLLYIECSPYPHRLSVQGLHSHIECDGSLEELLKMDSRGKLLRVSPSLVVNKKQIRAFDKRKRNLVLVGGYRCSVSCLWLPAVKRYLKQREK